MRHSVNWCDRVANQRYLLEQPWKGAGLLSFLEVCAPAVKVANEMEEGAGGPYIGLEEQQIGKRDRGNRGGAPLLSLSPTENVQKDQDALRPCWGHLHPALRSQHIMVCILSRP